MIKPLRNISDSYTINPFSWLDLFSPKGKRHSNTKAFFPGLFFRLAFWMSIMQWRISAPGEKYYSFRNLMVIFFSQNILSEYPFNNIFSSHLYRNSVVHQNNIIPSMFLSWTNTIHVLAWLCYKTCLIHSQDITKTFKINLFIRSFSRESSKSRPMLPSSISIRRLV